MVIEGLDYSTFTLLPQATNGHDGMMVQQRKGGKLSVINNRLTELHPHAPEYVPTPPNNPQSKPCPPNQQPKSCPNLGGMVFQWPAPNDGPPGLEHGNEAGYLPIVAEHESEAYIHNEDVDVEKVKSELADLMIDEDGELVHVNDETCSEGSSVSGDIADMRDFADSCESSPQLRSAAALLEAGQMSLDGVSSSAASSATSSAVSSVCSSASSSRDSSPERRPVSWARIATPKTQRTPSQRKTLKRTDVDADNSSSSDENDKPRLSRRGSHRRSKSKTRFNYNSTPYTPFPTPCITPGKTPKSTGAAPLSAKHSSPPLSARNSPPLSAKNSISTNHSIPTPTPLNGDDVNQLRSLHNLARVGSYENFEAAVVKWLANRAVPTSYCDSALEMESQRILKHLDL